MRLRLGRPRSTLIVAPHPDDEVIGTGGLIRALVRRGARVRVVVVTDGAGSHRASPSWPRARLVAARRRESRRALRRLGIMPADLIFCGLPDGGLAAARESCRIAIGRQIARSRGLDLIVGPARDDAHPDHRVVADAIGLARTPARRLSYRVWPARGRARGRTLRGFPAAACKRSLIRVYRTQTGAITDDPRGFAIARHELDPFARPIERYGEGAR